jgi:hypothetical protein
MRIQNAPAPVRWLACHWRPFLVLLLLGSVVLAAGRPFRKKPPCRTECLDTLTAARIELVRKNPAAIRDVYVACRGELAEDLGDDFADLSEEDRQLVFCMVVAYSMAPYGTSDAIELRDLLASPSLHCGNYPILLAELYRFFEGDGRPKVCLVGWTFGPHGMAYRPHPEPRRCLMLDPTVAMVVRATFDEVASGQPVERSRLLSFAHRPEASKARDFLAEAFSNGKFRPSHLLYYYEDLDHYSKRRGNPKDWPTPGAADQRASELTLANP